MEVAKSALTARFRLYKPKCSGQVKHSRETMAKAAFRTFNGLDYLNALCVLSNRSQR
jgi:hypothetical protein